MEVWLTEYRLAKAGKATDKSLRLLNDFDIFDHVEKLLSGGAELGKRGRGDDGFLDRLNEALILHQHRIETMLEAALDAYPVGVEKLAALPPLPTNDARDHACDEDDGSVLRG